MRSSVTFASFPRRAACIGFALTCLAACSSDENGSKITGGGGAGHGGSAAAAGSSGSPDAATDGGGFVVGNGGHGGRGVIVDGSMLPDACGLTAINAKSRQVNVLLVVDKSGSMTDKPTGFTTDKWTALKSAMSTALGQVEKSLSFGLELYPLSSDPKNPIPVKCDPTNCCDMPAAPGIEVPVAAGTTSVPAIIAALGATTPGGGTPTAEALKRANEYFTTGAGKSLAGDKYVLLATDGGPNCNAGAPQCTQSTCTLNLDGNCPSAAGNCCDPSLAGPTLCLDDVQTTDAITALNTAGIKTFVVGIPGSEAYKTYLDEFAQAGGEVNPAAPPKYFAVSASGGVGELTNVLTAITKTLIKTCELKLTSQPIDTNLLNVLVDGSKIARDDPNGWTLDTTTTPPTVDLTGSTCTKVETQGAESVQVVYGCPSLRLH